MAVDQASCQHHGKEITTDGTVMQLFLSKLLKGGGENRIVRRFSPHSANNALILLLLLEPQTSRYLQPSASTVNV